MTRLWILSAALIIGCGTSEVVTPPSSDGGVQNPDASGSLDATSALDAGIGGASDAAAIDAGAAPPDTGPVTLGPCVAPGNLPAPALTRGARVRLPRGMAPVHVLDVEPDAARDNLYLVGTGGFYVLRASGGGWQPTGTLPDLWIGQGGSGGRQVDFYEIEPFGAGLVTTTNRELGVSIIDASDPSQPSLSSSTPLIGASGAATVGSTLLVATYLGELASFDVSDPANPRALGTISGLGNPWELVVVGDRAYVADNRDGLIVLDVSNPAQPSVIASVATAGGAQDIDHVGGFLYLAVGSVGIEVFDLADPDAPASVAVFDSGAAVVAVSATTGLVWGATQEGLVVADTTDPTAPLPLGQITTQEWAMNVWADGATAHVADWTTMTVVSLDPAARVPAADIERSELYFLDGASSTATLEITNRGGAELIVAGASVDDSRFALSLDSDRLAPGGAARFTIEFTDDGQPVAASLCVATNDPSAPMQTIELKESSNTNTSTGESAPDFDLPDVDDDTIRYRLSDQLGHPVLLVYFATW